MDTQRTFALYDKMTLAELADRLDDLDDRRTPVGWSPQDAVHRSSLERRIVDRVARSTGNARASLGCHLEIQIRSSLRTARATVVGVAEGGIEVEADQGWGPGMVVDLVLPPNADDHGIRIRGTVVATEGARLRIALAEPTTEPHERRLRRFLRETIRHRTARN